MASSLSQSIEAALKRLLSRKTMEDEELLKVLDRAIKWEYIQRRSSAGMGEELFRTGEDEETDG